MQIRRADIALGYERYRNNEKWKFSETKLW